MDNNIPQVQGSLEIPSTTKDEAPLELKPDEQTEKIDMYIQQTENVSIPSVLLEYTPKENINFEENDIKKFFSQFGGLEKIHIKEKIAVALFKTFFAASVCKEFLSNEKNFKEDKKKDFSAKWFDLKTDGDALPDDIKSKFEEISKKNSVNLNKINFDDKMNNKAQQKKQEMQNNNMMQNGMIINNINNYIQPNLMQFNRILPNYQSIPNMQNMPNVTISTMNGIPMMPNAMSNLYFNNILKNKNIGIGLGNKNNNGQDYHMNRMHNNNTMPINTTMSLNNTMPLSGINSINNLNNLNNEEKNYGKFTCKFEILIPNDKEFQVARRLIGSKGCNMKKIISECKPEGSSSQESVKLRLRGKGSGYKEGPLNKESDEPLHLCISAKNQEDMKKACELVNNLLDGIYEDYKKHCAKNGYTPVDKIANKIDCGNSQHKNIN